MRKYFIFRKFLAWQFHYETKKRCKWQPCRPVFCGSLALTALQGQGLKREISAVIVAVILKFNFGRPCCCEGCVALNKRKHKTGTGVQGVGWKYCPADLRFLHACVSFFLFPNIFLLNRHLFSTRALTYSSSIFTASASLKSIFGTIFS
jgi:hypothetical protein